MKITPFDRNVADQINRSWIPKRDKFGKELDEEEVINV